MSEALNTCLTIYLAAHLKRTCVAIMFLSCELLRNQFHR